MFGCAHTTLSLKSSLRDVSKYFLPNVPLKKVLAEFSFLSDLSLYLPSKCYIINKKKKKNLFSLEIA